MGKLLGFCFIPSAQHVVYLPSFGIFRSDPKAKPGIAGGSQNILDILKAIVTPVAPFCLQPKRAEGQVQVVRDDQQVLQRDLFPVQPVANRLAAPIHVGARLEAKQRPPLDPEGPDIAQAAGFEGAFFLPGHVVQDLKPNIVPGPCVLVPYVAQPGDQEFFHGICFFKQGFVMLKPMVEPGTQGVCFYPKYKKHPYRRRARVPL